MVFAEHLNVSDYGISLTDVVEKMYILAVVLHFHINFKLAMNKNNYLQLQFLTLSFFAYML